LDNAEVDRSSVLLQNEGSWPQRMLRYDLLDLSNASSNHNQKYQAAKRAQSIDIDMDGSFEILVDNNGYFPHTRTWLWSTTSDQGVMDNVAPSLGLDLVNSFSSLIGDFNHDGKQDWLTLHYDLRGHQDKETMRLLVNQSKLDDRLQIIFYLDGGLGNRTGVGSILKLKVNNADNGNIKFQKTVQYSFGFLSPQNPSGTWLGWKDSFKKSYISDLKIYWPSKVGDKKNTDFDPLKKLAVAKINDAIFRQRKSSIPWKPIKVKINLDWDVSFF